MRGSGKPGLVPLGAMMVVIVSNISPHAQPIKVAPATVPAPSGMRRISVGLLEQSVFAHASVATLVGCAGYGNASE